MSETEEKAAAGAQENPGEEGGELSAEEESAKPMEAEVPHPEGYEEGGQEPPA